MDFQKYLEPVIETYTTGEWYPEVFKAKEEFFQKAGMVHEDDLEFESRMSLFMDWYLFDRNLPGIDLPPVRIYFQEHFDSMEEESRRIFEDLCETQHSLFRLKRFTFGKKNLIIEDLFTGKSIRVEDPHIQHGFNKGDVFEARLVRFKDKIEFSNGFCFHPREMEGFILSEIKKIRHQDTQKHQKLIFQLASMKLKHARFQHIDVKHIYSFESKF